MRNARVVLFAACASVILTPSSTVFGGAAAGPAITHGVTVGDIRADSATLWARGGAAGRLHVRLAGGAHRAIEPVGLSAARDFAGRVQLTGLQPDTPYRYRAWVTGGSWGGRRGTVVDGSFRTAPSETVRGEVRLAFGGDISGQNVCRDATEGIPIARTIEAFDPDIFVGLGDMIYGDDVCLPVGRYGNDQIPRAQAQATDLTGYWAHWRYNRSDAGLESLLATTSYVGVWDDHEVVNDFGPLTDTRATPPYDPNVHLMPLGRQAFIDYTPVGPEPSDPNRLYRSIRYGANLELIVLDTRQYRAANSAPDDRIEPKSMLGAQQLAWLESTLAASTATWKLIVSSVPMSIPTGFPAANGRDGWADFDQNTGFERELLGILRFAEERDIDDLVWITTDVHFGEAFRYTPFADDPDFRVHEIVTGPLNSGIFPNRDFDATLSPERLAFVGPAAATDVTTWEQAKSWFNFGTLEIDEDGTLEAGIVDTAGDRRFELRLRPS
jgi:alkaline phosphatase D